MGNKSSHTPSSMHKSAEKKSDESSGRMPTESDIQYLLDALLATDYTEMKASVQTLVEECDSRALWSSFFTSSQRTVLHICAEEGNVEPVELALKLGADVNVLDGIDGSTPLHLAAENGEDAVVKILMQFGAKNKPNETGIRPSDLAATDAMKNFILTFKPPPKPHALRKPLNTPISFGKVQPLKLDGTVLGSDSVLALGDTRLVTAANYKHNRHLLWWDVDKLKPIGQCRTTGCHIASLGSHVVSCGNYSNFEVFNATTMDLVSTVSTYPDLVWQMSGDPATGLLWTACYDGVSCYDIEAEGQCVAKTKYEKDTSSCGCVEANENIILRGFSDGRGMVVFDGRSLDHIYTQVPPILNPSPTQHPLMLYDAVFLDNILYTGWSYGPIIAYDTRKWSECLRVDYDAVIPKMAVTPSGDLFCTGGGNPVPLRHLDRENLAILSEKKLEDLRFLAVNDYWYSNSFNSSHHNRAFSGTSDSCDPELYAVQIR